MMTVRYISSERFEGNNRSDCYNEIFQRGENIYKVEIKIENSNGFQSYAKLYKWLPTTGFALIIDKRTDFEHGVQKMFDILKEISLAFDDQIQKEV